MREFSASYGPVPRSIPKARRELRAAFLRARSNEERHSNKEQIALSLDAFVLDTGRSAAQLRVVDGSRASKDDDVYRSTVSRSDYRDGHTPAAGRLRINQADRVCDTRSGEASLFELHARPKGRLRSS